MIHIIDNKEQNYACHSEPVTDVYSGGNPPDLQTGCVAVGDCHASVRADSQ